MIDCEIRRLDYALHLASAFRTFLQMLALEFLMNLDTPDRVAGRLAHVVAITGGIEAVDAYYAALAKVTPDDIMRAAQKYFVPERRTIVVLKGVAK